jgi:hypothetical protein
MYFTNPAWTSNGVDFPAADLAAVVNSVDGEFSAYLEHNSSTLSIIGQAADFLGTGTPMALQVNPHQVILNFPATYQSTYSGTSGYDMTLDGSSFGVDSVRIKQDMNRDYVIDGWGSITTPIGTYDALRVDITETAIDSTWGMIAGIWQLFDNSSDTRSVYDWWTDDASVGFPVVSMEVDGGGNAQRVTYLKALPSPDGVTETLDGSKISIYPNPTSTYVNFVIESDNASSIEVYDATGKLVNTQRIERLATTFDMSSATTGMYIYMLKDASGALLHNGKFSVVK